MSARATNEWKVGAFVVGTLALLIAFVFWLGAQRFDVERVRRVTYFDESVQGLEIGAPVKIRGVTIGRVEDIALAPDQRLVEVWSGLRVDALERLGLLGGNDLGTPGVGAAATDALELRMIVSSQGITGVKFLEADFFPAGTPRLELDFSPPPTYVPSAPSTLKSLEDALRGLAEDLPDALAEFRSLARTVDERTAAIDTEGISRSFVELADQARSVLDESVEGSLAADLHHLVNDLRATARSVDALAADLAGDESALRGLAASVSSVETRISRTLDGVDEALAAVDLPGTAEAVRGAGSAAEDVLRSTLPATRELPALLGELRAAARRIERLAARLERDPGVILRGGDQ